MQKVVLVFFGSGLGGAARYLLGGAMQRALGPAFPYGTITINALGSFLIALIMALSLRTTWIGADTRLFLTTGIMGGFTTYSTFNYETLSLAQQGTSGLAAVNVAATVFGCLAAGVLGLLAARLLAGE